MLLQNADEPHAVDCVDAHERTPLMLAVENGHIDSVLLLISHSSNIQLNDIYGRTALHRGVSSQWKIQDNLLSSLGGLGGGGGGGGSLVGYLTDAGRRERTHRLCAPPDQSQLQHTAQRHLRQNRAA